MKEALLVVALFLIFIVLFIVLRPGRNSRPSFIPAPPPTATPMARSPLEIISPALNSRIGNLFVANLRLATPPENIRYRITDSVGRVLVENTQYVQQQNFKLSTTYAVPTGNTGIVDIHIDGDPHVISIPVTFPVPQAMTRIYFYASDRETLIPVNRLVPAKANRGRAQVDALVVGLSTMDIQKGYKTAISPSARVTSYKVLENITSVSFSRDIFIIPTTVPSAAFCSSEKMSDQLKKTLIQNADIYDVSIAVDNRLPSNLQP